jgi:hypothetical protein
LAYGEYAEEAAACPVVLPKFFAPNDMVGVSVVDVWKDPCCLLFPGEFINVSNVVSNSWEGNLILLVVSKKNYGVAA